MKITRFLIPLIISSCVLSPLTLPGAKAQIKDPIIPSPVTAPIDATSVKIEVPQHVPEPLSIIGTLIGGSAVWSMRKKLAASTKSKVKQ
jgi:hypothetical protein